MALLDRVFQKIFGKSADSNDMGIVGSKANNNPQTSKDIAEIQSLSNWESGMRNIVSTSNAPYLQDHNSLFYVITYQLAYLFQAGIAEWDSSTEYFSGKSVVLKSGNIYIAKDDSTGIEPGVTNNWSDYWVRLFDLLLQGVSYSSLPTSIFGNYKKGDELTHKDEFGNKIKIKALKDNPLAPSNTNIYYIKSRIKITAIVTSFPSNPTSDIVGNIYYNSSTNEIKKVIGYSGFSVIGLVGMEVGKFNTFIDSNGVYYDYDGTNATDVSTNYDWVVDDIYIKQQKKATDFWYIVWSSGIAEQGGVFSVTIPTSSMSFIHGFLDIKIYAEENDSFAGIIEKRANTDYYKFGASFDGFTISTTTVDGVTHKFITQPIFSAGNIDGSSATHNTKVTWYIKGIMSPVQNIR